MNWLEPYKKELVEVFAEAERLIAAFPAPLNERGLAYVSRFHPFRADSTKNYICYLLPYWLDHDSVENKDAAICSRMSLANVFVMLHFFIQDDLMDTAPTKWKEQLALDHLLHMQFLELYRPMFDSGSPFWTYFRQYVTEWATSVSDEREREAFHDRPSRIAHKASPVKLASTGLLLLSGRSELIPDVSDMVDEVLITLQMADDWTDWREDLQQGSANTLIAFINRERRTAAELYEKDLETSIYVGGYLSRFAQLAVDRHQRLKAYGLRLPHLIDFHEYLTANLLSAASTIERDKSRLLQGGFAYWLSKNAN
ncbi:hypothetical protein FE783_12075 [Paenibacillus mesophilus]|uniref:hypothetical protein n=1 Tax=Paenibacillus mesophilus TaxID=2582849 RepID=UPI00110E6CD8|nr:hypothetical protein [Paenibacillus mesophilus]TMV50284.1 hypothetical protein FE783_12075 [Paenibacillus mesophilus]